MSFIVLSRKYRPKIIDELIGQDVVSNSLKNCLENKKIPHAFLFHGIRGVGKTTVARILARCVSCLNPLSPTKPCGKCDSCLNFDNHLDIVEIDAASKTGVDDIREIIDACQYAPVMGNYRIFIIDEVHMLSKNAFNALLKTLEEPPSYVKFIFATTEIQKVPDTILSRCVIFQLKPVNKELISNHLINIAKKEGYKLNIDAANILAEESEGSVRDSLTLLEQATMLVNNNTEILPDMVLQMIGGARLEEIEGLLDLTLKSQTKEALEKIDNMLKNGCDSINIYKQLQKALYSRIINSVKKDKNLLNNLLYLWQILLKQAENFKNSAYPDYILSATIVILAQTCGFPNLSNLDIKKQLYESNNKTLDNILKQFPEAIITEIE